MNLKSTTTRAFQTAAFGLLLLLIGSSTMNGATLSLQGQSYGDTNWIDGNLTGWEELDLIPCRVHLSGGPVTNKTINIYFAHLIGPIPGFSDLGNFTASPNAVITSTPTLTMSDSGTWSYSLTVTVTDDEPADICFVAQLAGGAYLNPGSSLQLYGDPECMGRLQIFKPASGGHTLAKPVWIIRGEMRKDKTFLVEFDTMFKRSYILQYSSDFVNWNTAQHAVIGSGSITNWIDGGLPETLSKPGDDPARFYRLVLLP